MGQHLKTTKPLITLCFKGFLFLYLLMFDTLSRNCNRILQQEISMILCYKLLVCSLFNCGNFVFFMTVV